MISKTTMTLKLLFCFLHFKAFRFLVPKLSYSSSVNTQKSLYSSTDCSWALFVPDEQVDCGTLFCVFCCLFFSVFSCVLFAFLFVFLFDPLSPQGSIKFHLILRTQRHVFRETAIHLSSIDTQTRPPSFLCVMWRRDISFKLLRIFQTVLCVFNVDKTLTAERQTRSSLKALTF